MDNTQKLLELCKDLCHWLSHQRGMIPSGYAKDLAKLVSLVEKQKKEDESKTET